MLFNSVFAIYTILTYFFIFLIIKLYFSITAVIAQVFNPTAETVNPIEIPTEEAKVEIDINLVTVEAKRRKRLI